MWRDFSRQDRDYHAFELTIPVRQNEANPGAWRDLEKTPRFQQRSCLDSDDADMWSLMRQYEAVKCVGWAALSLFVVPGIIQTPGL